MIPTPCFFGYWRCSRCACGRAEREMQRRLWSAVVLRGGFADWLEAVAQSGILVYNMWLHGKFSRRGELGGVGSEFGTVGDGWVITGAVWLAMNREGMSDP